MQAVYAVVKHGRWVPGVGDPTFSGWLITGGYAISVFGCIWAARCPRSEHSVNGRRFWFIVALVLFLLGINKQLDLQTWLWHTSRAMAKAQGWYGYRRLVQYAFLACIAVVGSVAIRALVRIVRPVRREHILTLVGTIVLFCYVLLRVVSIHPVDVVLTAQIAGVTVKDVLETAGILLVCAGAASARFSSHDSGQSLQPR